MQGLSRAKAIAIIIGQLAPGGSERQLFMFLAHCDRSRWTPVVYVSGELGFWEGPIRELGIPVVLLRGPRLAKMWRFRMASLSQKAKCFFSWPSYTNGFGLAMTGCTVRRIGSFRNALFADLPKCFRWFWSLMSVAGVCTVACNSRETMKQLSDRHPAKAVIYVPNAVEIPTRERVREWGLQWRARLSLRDDTLLVLGVGRLAPQKQFARFIDGIAQVSQQISPFCLAKTCSTPTRNLGLFAVGSCDSLRHRLALKRESQNHANRSSF
jgi:hypothetical protein